MSDPRAQSAQVLPTDAADPTLVGRIWVPGAGPRLVAVAGDALVDVTALGPTMTELVQESDPASRVRAILAGDATAAAATDAAAGTTAAAATETLSAPTRWDLDEVLAATVREADRRRGAEGPVELAETVLLSPVDLQVLKAAGVTFVRSMIERVIEERVGGDPTKAAAVRDQLKETLGESIRDIRPGSPEALAALEVLRENGLWSQYLQVGLGTHPEVFTKAPILSSVGHGSDVGIAGISTWNNPEPELVLVIDGAGQVKGATLGNDANLRDMEGASALLLPLAKDNNASAALGPFIRLFDDAFTLEDAAATTITMRITGEDGFELEATAPQSDISRPVSELAAHTINRRHQYPDGLVLYCGTPFAPTEDRGEPGQGFTHHEGDLVSISSPQLGTLTNRVTPSESAPVWDYGVLDLVRDLHRAG
ncbi:fumarylacetoacetate hydrolase family protein [Georgenia sp. Z1491]|uniref:fumarylacetoacetate hydrolase family protein n=1 Tax=Georgenia sp. Z1491 TaxID=3416707 RepID=UPI003CE7A8F8